MRVVGTNRDPPQTHRKYPISLTVDSLLGRSGGFPPVSPFATPPRVGAGRWRFHIAAPRCIVAGRKRPRDEACDTKERFIDLRAKPDR